VVPAECSKSRLRKAKRDGGSQARVRSAAEPQVVIRCPVEAQDIGGIKNPRIPVGCTQQEGDNLAAADQLAAEVDVADTTAAVGLDRPGVSDQLVNRHVCVNGESSSER
jgi:hypothetical protein